MNKIQERYEQMQAEHKRVDAAKRRPAHKANQRFTLKLLALRDEARRLGLYATMHALTEASRKVGYEMAEKLERTAQVGS